MTIVSWYYKITEINATNNKLLNVFQNSINPLLWWKCKLYVCVSRSLLRGYYTTKPSFTNFCWNLSLWNQTLQCNVCHWKGRGCACPVMVHAEMGSSILGTYATAVVMIKLKMIVNPCEVIAEAEMRRKYILLTSQSLMFLCSESL